MRSPVEDPTVMLATALILTAIAAGPAEKVGRMDHQAIAEASGIVASRRYPGIFWVHNDSGNPPALFAVRKDGSLVREYAVSAPNVDWEDIAIDDSGHLFLGDIGNNGGHLPLRSIYRVDEPDPSRETKEPLRVTLSTHYMFPKSGAFDAESLFIDGDLAMLVTKSFEGRDAEIYSVPLNPPATLFRPARAEKRGALKGFKSPATGADLSADGRRLAVCSLDQVRIYRRDADGRWLPEIAMKGPKGQVEAICWDGMDLILANEERDIFRISEKSWRDASSSKGGRR